MFTVQNTPLYDEIRPFINAFANNGLTTSAVIYAQGGPFGVWKVMSLNRVRDYVKSTADVYKIVVRMGMGDYVYRVYPARSEIMMLLKTKRAGQTKTTSEQFMAFMNTETSPSMTASSVNNMDAESLNLNQFIDIEFDLVPQMIFNIKNIRVRGTERGITAKQLIQNTFDKHAKPLGIEELIMSEPDNTSVRQNMVLNDGVHVLSMPTYAHHFLGGLYNEGVGTYVQRYQDFYYMFVYPLYNTKRFSSTDRKAVIVVAPEGQFSEIETTYLQEGNTVSILITGERKYTDNADNRFENEGVGFKRVAASAFMTKPVGISKGKVSSFSADLQQQEVMGGASDRVLNRPNSTRTISDNPYLDRSKLSFFKSASLIAKWENSNDELIYPGMPCRVLMFLDGKMAALEGCISYAETAVMLQGNVTISKAYSSTTLLSITVGSDRFVTPDRSAQNTPIEHTDN